MARATSGASANAAIATCACSSPTAHAPCCAPPPWRSAAANRSNRCDPGRSPCRPAPITTKPPVRSPTSSRASVTPRFGTRRHSRGRASITSSNVRPLRCPSEPVLPTAACPGDRSPIMANRDHPTPCDADNTSGAVRCVACSDWHHDDADSMSARDTTIPPQMPDIRLQALPQQPSNPIRSPTCGRSPYTMC